MARVLVTGMSGTGKSSALIELGLLGYRVVDTDDPGWTDWIAVPGERGDGEYVWAEDRMTELLGESLFTIGNCATARSYYFNPAGEPTLLRPSSTETALKEASEFPLCDYQIA